MTTFPDSDPAAAPRPDGPGGDQDALESPQVPDVTSPEVATPPTEDKPSDQPGGTPPAPADPNGSAAAAGSRLELALTELQGRRAGLLAEIAALEQQRDRIRQEIGAQAIGQSEWIANRVKGFQAYLVGPCRISRRRRSRPNWWWLRWWCSLPPSTRRRRPRRPWRRLPWPGSSARTKT